MKLITTKVKKDLKPLYTYEKTKPENTPVALKLFNPAGVGTWYITEWDGEDVMYGLCCIQDAELGYVSLSELASFKGRFGLGIERDMHWTGTLADAMKWEGYTA